MIKWLGSFVLLNFYSLKMFCIEFDLLQSFENENT